MGKKDNRSVPISQLRKLLLNWIGSVTKESQNNNQKQQYCIAIKNRDSYFVLHKHNDNLEFKIEENFYYSLTFFIKCRTD